ncbi:TetR family transcriptional regulator [Streptomyces sp. NPDC093544]|uniref:TetR/AcrR family transcriptional regulator n=1 Tax=Streptomyces sp. NPDC093544 TaxID=3155200 RepID=UPI003423B258
MTQRLPPRQRTQQRVRDSIIKAAFELFADRGFADVSVTQIAEHAEVGRMTYFRYFGDKQEVVFAGEQDMIDSLVQGTTMAGAEPLEGPLTLADALARIRVTVRAMGVKWSADTERYRLTERLLAENPELQDRMERKLLRGVRALAQALQESGTPEPTAVLAAHLGLACYQTGKQRAGADPTALVENIEAAFAELEQLRTQ